MTKPCIITVAITGSVPTKQDTAAVPVTPSEQIESAQEAFEAGASVVHIHVRNEDQTPSSDPEKFHQVQQGIEKYCPGMIIQFSTGGRGRNQDERASMLHYRPDMASLTTGSVNFPKGIYENPPDFVEGLAAEMLKYTIKPEIEVFDSAMLFNAEKMVKTGLLKSPLHLQFVLGIPNAMPARRSLLEFLLSETRKVLPDASWGAAGIGRHQFEVNQWCLELGGHCRTGLEDNIKISSTRLATSNAELVSRIVDIADAYNRHIASASEARSILRLDSPELSA